MLRFPTYLIPANRDKFISEYKFNRECCKLRRLVADYIYSGDKGGFDLKCDGSGLDYTTYDKGVVDRIVGELHGLGWKTRIAYGNTTLFVYLSSDELPQIGASTMIEC